MSQMKELYQAVAGDATLQANYAAIAKDAESAEKGVIEKRLVAFAKDAGFDVSIADAKAYFSELLQANAMNAELTDLELDAVAGGKSGSGIGYIINSVTTVGLSCLVLSIQYEIQHNQISGAPDCASYFD